MEPEPAPGPAGRRFGLVLGVALALATILNGLGVYLKRVGVVQRDRYDAYWAVHCGPAGITDAPFGIGRRCAGPNLSAPRGVLFRRERPYARYVYEVTPAEVPLKLAKDVLVLALVGAVAVALVRKNPAGRVARAAWPAAVLLCLVALSAARAALSQGPWMALAGLRSFGFLAVALATVLVGGGRGEDQIAGAMKVLLWLQVALLVPELIYGMPTAGHLPFLMLPQRLGAALVLPNSLGAFAVAALAFAVAFATGPAALGLVAVLLVVFAAGSATGIFALLTLCAALILRAVGPRWRLLVVGLVVLACSLLISLLPTVLHRPDVFNSLWSDRGRVARLEQVLGARWADVVIGRGLGSGSNAAFNAARGSPDTASRGDDPAAILSDSTVTLLLQETGLAGLALFGWMLLSAWQRDPSARIFYLVIILTSLTTNVTELFPVNVLLGLALGHSFSDPSPAPAPDAVPA